MSESEIDLPGAPPLPAPEDRLDEDDRLKPEFVRSVMERVEAGGAEPAERGR